MSPVPSLFASWKPRTLTSYMTAVLYQSGSFCSVTASSSQRPQAQHVRRFGAGIQPDVVLRAVPDVGRVREQVVRLERTRVLQAELPQVQPGRALLRLMRIEVDDHQHWIGAPRGHL